MHGEETAKGFGTSMPTHARLLAYGTWRDSQLLPQHRTILIKKFDLIYS